MSDIVLTAGIRQNLLALQSTASLTSIAQTRLATGKKVNTALDNATNFFTSAALTARATDLAALLDSMSNGIKTLQAADNGMTAITKTVESLQSAVTRAMQDQSWQGMSYTIDAAAIGTSLAKNLTFSGGLITGNVNVALNTAGAGGTASALATSAAYAAPVAARPALYTAQNVYAAPGAAQALTISVTPAGGAAQSLNVTLDTTETSLQQAIDKINGQILLDPNLNGVIQAQDDGTGRLQIASLANSDATISVSGAGETAIFGTETTQIGSDGQHAFTVNGTAVALTSADSPNLASAINTANLQLITAGSAFEAYDAGGGKLGVREKVAQGATLTLGGADTGLFTGTTNTGTAGTGGAVKTVDQLVAAINGDVNLTGKVRATNDNGRLRVSNISTLDLTVVGATSTAIDGSASTRTIAGNIVRKNLVTEYNELRDQLDKLADDASFNGINLLRGDILKLSFNEMNTSILTVQSQNPNGVNTLTLGLVTMDDGTISSDTLLSSRLDVVRQALSTLRSQSGAFGTKLALVQNRQDFTKMMINTLQTGADNLVLSDTNEEGANLLALQTRQQLSTTALSLANQASQGILRLFG